MDYKSKLNTNQYEACISNANYLRIIAGAGTGKTRTLTHRIAYSILNDKIEPFRVLAITFTNKAAKEMKDRVVDLLSNEEMHFFTQPLITTFHGFCNRFLKQEILNLEYNYNLNFSIIDEEDKKNLLKNIFGEYSLDKDKDLCLTISNYISHYKKLGLLPQDINFDTTSFDHNLNTYVKNVYTEYQKQLERQNLLDFDDLIIYTMKVLLFKKEICLKWQKRFSHIFVDEFQDTDPVQYDLIKLLLNTQKGEETKLTVVGDPDQTIYTWRGADSNIISKTLEKDFSTLETIILNENYRSTKEILDIANKLISHNSSHIKKDLIPFKDDLGEKVEYKFYLSDKFEASAVASEILYYKNKNNLKYSDFAILYRNNYLSRVLEKQLMQNNIPYKVYGGLKFFERKEIKDAVAYLKLLVNSNDDLSFVRTLSAPNKGIGKVTLDKANKLLKEKKSSLFDIFKLDDIKVSSPSRSALDYFYSAYDEFKKDENNIYDFEKIHNYLCSVGLEHFIQKTSIEEQIKNDIFSSDNDRFENYKELLFDLEEFLSISNVDLDGKEVKNTLIDYINNLELQSPQDEIEDKDEVMLSTCHVAKGLEFKVVFVCGLNQGIFPSSHSLNDDNYKIKIEEERRLFYVACTRAMEKLFLSSYSYTSRPNDNYDKSMFLKEIDIIKPLSTSYNNNNYIESSFNKYNNVEVNISGASFNSNIKTSDIKYHIGDNVYHDKFGKGRVIDVDNKYVVVDFDSQEGLKKLISSAPQLRKGDN